jgi:hypothetical protein
VHLTHYLLPFSPSAQLNTFQCVMASDGQSLFVIFLYADIQWIKSSFDPPAQVGFNAGDRVHHYVLPGSQTEAVANLGSFSNVGIPGKWMFKVSGTTIESGGCSAPTGKYCCVASLPPCCCSVICRVLQCCLLGVVC